MLRAELARKQSLVQCLGKGKAVHNGRSIDNETVRWNVNKLARKQSNTADAWYSWERVHIPCTFVSVSGLLRHGGQFEHGGLLGFGHHHTPRQLGLGVGPITAFHALSSCQWFWAAVRVIWGDPAVLRLFNAKDIFVRDSWPGTECSLDAEFVLQFVPCFFQSFQLNVFTLVSWLFRFKQWFYSHAQDQSIAFVPDPWQIASHRFCPLR